MGSHSSFLFTLLATAGLLATACGKTESEAPAGTETPVPEAGAPCDGCPVCTPGAMKPDDDGCNTCTCNESGGWGCTDEACTACAEGDVRQDGCNTCSCVLGSWACTMKQCAQAECVPGEQRFDNESWDQCRVCTCVSPGGWSCEVGDCSCKPNDQIFAADGCNLCSCDESGQWGHCTEGGCGDRCPLPRGGIECDQSPVYAKIEGYEPCCSYSCPSEVPPGWSSYPSLAECEGCPQGFSDCDGDPSNGCETDVRSSVDHCGGCDTLCFVQHATAACEVSACIVSLCDADWEDCNGDPSDGCETPSTGSRVNCGVCGVFCEARANEEGYCFDGICMWTGCVPGFADCNSDIADGCETDLTTDADHCGVCGGGCRSVHGSASCFDSECLLTCDEGYADCNDAGWDGCEVNIENDLDNCGACNLVCSGPQPMCLFGTCGIE